MIFALILASWRRTVAKQPEWLFVDEWRSINLSLLRRWSDPSGEGFRIRLRDGVPGAASRGVPQPTARGSVGVLPSKGAHPRYQVSSKRHTVETLMCIYSYTACSLSGSLLSIGTALWHSGKVIWVLRFLLYHNFSLKYLLLNFLNFSNIKNWIFVPSKT